MSTHQTRIHGNPVSFFMSLCVQTVSVVIVCVSLGRSALLYSE